MDLDSGSPDLKPSTLAIERFLCYNNRQSVCSLLFILNAGSIRWQSSRMSTESVDGVIWLSVLRAAWYNGWLEGKSNKYMPLIICHVTEFDGEFAIS